MSYFIQPTPEQIAAHDRQLMEFTADNHLLNSMIFQELQQDHLRILTALLTGIAHSGESAALVAARWQGTLQSAMQIRFNVCAACGAQHDFDAEAAAILNAPAEQAEPEAAPACEPIDIDVPESNITFLFPEGHIDSEGGWHPSMGAPDDDEPEDQA